MKTRLARDLGPDKALELYMGFVLKTLKSAGEWAEKGKFSGSRREIWICFTPVAKESAMKNWLNREYTFLAQTGKDLGDRMASAMAAAFESAADAVSPKVILVGSDIPDLSASHLEAACEALNRTPLVWGPSLDGGYWLVGASRCDQIRKIFSKIPWGTDQVLSKSLERCRELELPWTMLDPLNDVDTVDDLKTTAFYHSM